MSNDDQQAAAAAGLYDSEQLDSEAMIVDACPIQCTTSQTLSHVSNVKPSVSGEVSLVDAAVPLVPPDVNFNSSSNYTCLSDNEVRIDTTSSLRRPALSHRAASEIVNNITRYNETVAVGADVGHSDAVSVDEDVQSKYDEISASDAVLATDKVLSSGYQSSLINDIYSTHGLSLIHI